LCTAVSSPDRPFSRNCMPAARVMRVRPGARLG
jgi:hypothetical protein